MHYHDHYHDPSMHLQLTRQSEDELLRAANRREIRPGVLGRVRASLRSAVPARAATEQVALDAEAMADVIRELRAVRQRLEALEARAERPA